MAKWGSKLPQNLQWLKGSPYIWYDFSIKGARFRDSTKTDSIKLAKDRLAAERNKVITGDYKKPQKTLTLTEAFAKYWIQRAQFKKTAHTSIKPYIEHMLAYFKPHTLLHEIGASELTDYISHCQTQPYIRPRYCHKTRKMVKGKTPKTLSNASINRRMAVFQGMHGEAWETWGVLVQPIKFSKLKLDEPDRTGDTLTEEEAQRYFDNAPPHIIDFAMIALYGGLRKNNILTLRGSQIDVKQMLITVRGKSRKKEGKLITVTIVQDLLRYIMANGLHLRDYVISVDGKPLDDIKTSHYATLRRAKITKKIRPHDLRHTCGTWLYEKTGDIKLVKDWLGHSDYKTTERYTHTTKDSMREKANKAGLPKFRLMKAVKKKQVINIK